MKIIVYDDKIVSTARDDQEITGVHPECLIYYAPDSTLLIDPASGPENPRPYAFSELGISQDDSDRYEALAGLKRTDADMARIGEDILAALVAAEVIAEADLPVEAQAKIAARRAWRQVLSGE